MECLVGTEIRCIEHESSLECILIVVVFMQRLRPFLNRLSYRYRGALSELFAAWFLRCHGFRVLHRNTRAYGVEVDIVAWRKGVLYIIEVKSRMSSQFGAPETAVDRKRRRRQWRAAIYFADQCPMATSEVSFGIVAISGVSFAFYPDAWGWLEIS